MKLSDGIYLVASAEADEAFTDELDCQVYIINSGDELVMIDAGSGLTQTQILRHMQGDGLDPDAIRWLLLTHVHGDHAAGSAGLKSQFPQMRVAVSAETADWLREGDERAISLDLARAVGLYPPDFQFSPCPVDRELRDGDIIPFGDLQVEVLDTSGHCIGHLSFVVDVGVKKALFTGDALFPGGKILLQNIWDCNLQDTIRSVERLAAQEADHLLAGHLEHVLDEARAHIKLATNIIDALGVPPNLG